MVKLVHRDHRKAICAYTDASDTYYAGVNTQWDPNDFDKKLEEQRHEPLEFLRASFKGSEEYWTTFEK